MSDLQDTITERRRQTRNSVYRYLYQADAPKTQQEIAYNLALSLPTVHQNLTELLNAGLLCYCGAQRSTGGRRARNLAIEPAARFAVGISITDTRLRFFAADLRLNELAYHKTPHLAMNELDDPIGTVADALEQFLDQNHLDRARLLGVGVAVPAVLDPARTHIVLSPTLRTDRTTLASLADTLPYPCYIDNDATCGGHAESFAHPETKNVAYLSLETGVGGAVLLAEGRPYTGNNCRSGEFGHMCVEPGGLQCQCGRRGCLEAYCTARRLSDDLGVTLEEFFAALAAGNPQYAALWQDFLQHLAIGVCNIRMALDCDVILGGYLTPYLEPYLPELCRRVAALDPFWNGEDYVHLSAWPRRAVVRGAALHFIQEFVESI